ncbi:50S ribosomal protein L16 [Thermofilum pendens]|uniref:Large ribosomal subunit protein uL16 n=1 Tax=Thermofilum pendens (strain DSM 2475 / Hrk 5) TaxID=368408 RepID=RL10E_THEPD|nr:50S ribosomal protein L16 [Thermofilum pendens]A1RXM2.1 RecName: Full=Large ribosomal subunit protein uL16; AltName: Full=50S ribosomal protein L10e [Thermofilum pendens Hrk 5]ABL77952.1 LSU ribosomal protein L10AE [Thermofilum pendens Hrk 5]
MPLRPGRCYRHFGTPPYTRLEYIKSNPPVLIPKFDLGNPKGNFNTVLKLVVMRPGQIRANALEAARQHANKYLTAKVGEANFFLRVAVFPHHILRENKMMAMAGADRLQDGMRLSFGTPVGRAARVEAGQIVMLVKVDAKNIDHAKEALRRAASKIPLPSRIIVEQAQ